MSRPPVVTVVIPVYERLHALQAVLRYFAYQTYPLRDVEVIVIDDGSPERIGEALAREVLPFELTVLRQANRGRAAARNTGIRAARGSLIVFCDADRVPDPDLIARHALFHEGHPNAAAVGVPWDCFLPFEQIRAGGMEVLGRMVRFARAPAYYQIFCKLLATAGCRSPLGWAGFLVGNSSVQRADLLAAGGFDEALTSWGIEHFELALRLTLQRSLSIHYLHGGASYHIPHARSPEYFRAGIETAAAVLADRPHAAAIALLRRFLLGELSLQEFAQAYCGKTDTRIASEPPIFFRQLVNG